MIFDKSRTLKVRIERTDSTESRPCYYVGFEANAEEINVMVERDYQLRLATTEDPDIVQRRDAQEILIEEVNKPEYNSAKKHHRHTAYRASVSCEDSEPVSVIDADLGASGYLVTPGWQPDPADGWVGELRVWDAINSLPERDRNVLIDVKLNGLTQGEAAKRYGVSQPMIAKILKRATARLAVILK